MKLKTLMIMGLSFGIFLIMALLPQQNLYYASILSFVLILDILFLLILFFFEGNKNLIHWVYLITMALSILFVFAFRLGKTTFATFLLGGLFIVVYLLLIILLALDYEAKFLDKFIESLSTSSSKKNSSK